MRKVIYSLLSLLLIVILCACNSNDVDKKNSRKLDEDTEPGFISTVVPYPDFLGDSFIGWNNSGAIADASGNSIYIYIETENDQNVICAYDTINDSWEKIDLDFSYFDYKPEVEQFYVTENTFWILANVGLSQEESYEGVPTYDVEYYLYCMDRNTGEVSCNLLSFWNLNDYSYFSDMFAIDDERVILSDYSDINLVLNKNGEVLEKTDLGIWGSSKAGNKLIVSSKNGQAELNAEILSCGEAMELGESIYDSALNHFISSNSDTLFLTDLDTMEKTAVFSWLDVAPSLDGMFGSYGYENSKGSFFYLTNDLIKVEAGMVPKKKPLVLACFGNAADDGYETSLEGMTKNGGSGYTIGAELKDAVLRFNHSDPEYKIQIKPVIYHDDAERDRLLIEFATSSDIDIIDTSLLPPGALDSSIMVDLLPYIDSDKDLSRDDFIPALLNSMTKKGGLYFYTNKYTMLTMALPTRLYPGKEAWTGEALKNIIEENPEAKLPAGHDNLLDMFSWAASAEFMDWDNMSCSFDSPAFVGWLEILKLLPQGSEAWSEEPFLFNIFYDVASNYKASMYSCFNENYSIAGFPDAEGSGSYFIPMGQGIWIHNIEGSELATASESTSLGIMASGKNLDGAWRFMKIFMQGGETSKLFQGIPVNKVNFEKILAREIEQSKKDKQNGYGTVEFDESDAELIRQIVYSSDKLVHTDTEIINTIQNQIEAYLGGSETAEECANQIQSRMSIYMTENG